MVRINFVTVIKERHRGGGTTGPRTAMLPVPPTVFKLLNEKFPILFYPLGFGMSKTAGIDLTPDGGFFNIPLFFLFSLFSSQFKVKGTF